MLAHSNCAPAPVPLARKLSLCLLPLLWQLLSPAWALDTQLQLGQYPSRNWQTDQGLPQNSVFSVAQSADGYLWLGTQEGLARFDGVRFTVFNQQNTEALRSNHIGTLRVDRRGSLWLGTFDGGLVRYRGGQFVRIGAQQGLSNDTVLALIERKDGSLWLGTRGGGINHWSGDRFSQLRQRDGLAHDVVNALAEDREGALWAGTDAGLSHYAGGRFTSFTTAQGLPHEKITALAVGKNGRIWVGTAKGLARNQDGSASAFEAIPELGEWGIRSLYEDAEQALWVGTDGGGIFRIANGQVQQLSTKQGLAGDNIGAIFEDAEGSVWLGSDTGGLTRLRNGSFATFSAPEGLSNDNARSVLAARDGSVWVGSFGGLSQLKDGRFRNFSKADGLAAEVVLSLAETADGSLWAGTLGGGLSRMQAGRFRSYSKAQGLSHEIVLSLLASRAGGLWIGTRAGGLNYWADDKIQSFGPEQGLTHQDIRALHEAADGSLWIGTLGGGLFHYRNGEFLPFTSKQGLSSDKIFSLHGGSDGSLWIGTFGGGLIRYKNGVFHTITARQGLHEDTVFQILEDRSGHLWLSGNRGISRVVLAELNALADGTAQRVRAVSFGKADGLRSIEGNGGHQPVGTKDAQGALWFATTKGVVRVRPEALATNMLPPPVVLESIEVGGKPAPLHNGLEVEPGQTDIALHYTALSFARPEAVRFRYRLQGFDQDWVPAGNRRDAYYTNLPPGSYRFEVQAINEDGVHSARPASLQFTLKPQIWQHPAFVLVYLLAGALLFWLLLLISQRRVRRLTAQKAELIDVINERDSAQAKLTEANRELELRAAALTRSTAELEKFAYIVSHDLREPLRAIVSFTQLLSRRYSDQLDAIGQGYIDYAVEGAFAMRRSLDNLLAYLSITGQRTTSDLAPIATAFAQAQRNLALTIKSSGATISNDPLPVLPGKPLEMTLLLENLLANAIKFQPLGQSAKVHLSAEQNTIEKTWHFTMTDNGIGIAQAHLEQIFELFNRLNPGEDYLGTGVGLAICRRIVEAHGGRIWAESTLGAGSRLHFTLPG